MKTKVIFLALPLLTLSFYSNASGLYVSAKAGATMLNSSANTLEGGAILGALKNTLDNTELGSLSSTRFTPSIAIGFDMSEMYDVPVRAELAFSKGGKVEGTLNGSGQVTSVWYRGTGYRETFPANLSMSQNSSVNTIMINGYYDYDIGSSITPWFMAGVGAAFVKSTVQASGGAQSINISSDSVSVSKTNLAWSAGFGATWKTTAHFALDAGYRYINAGEVNLDGSVNQGIVSASGESRSRLRQHSVELGMRYTF